MKAAVVYLHFDSSANGHLHVRCGLRSGCWPALDSSLKYPTHDLWETVGACGWRTQDEEHGGHLVAVLAKQHEGVLGGSGPVTHVLEVAGEECRKFRRAAASEETYRGASPGGHQHVSSLLLLRTDITSSRVHSID